MSEDILRYVDSIHREKNIDLNIIFESVETALLMAAKRKHPGIEELRVRIARDTGDIRVLDGDRPIDTMDITDLGRIAAQTAKQVMIQRIREAERDVVYEEYEHKIDQLVSATIQRVEHGTVIVSLGRVEGILPRQEQVFNETYRPGETMRFYMLNVKKKGQKVVIILSRTHANLVKELFEQDVPEIFDHTVEIRGIVREPGYRTKIAVYSSDQRIDPVGACVGVRGNRIRNIVEELSGEKIDIVRWNESMDIYIRNALAPAEIESIIFDRDSNNVKLIVPQDQLSLAIGSKGQNVRLSSRLTGMHLDIMTVEEHSALRARGLEELATLPGMDEAMSTNLAMGGIASFDDIAAKGVEALMTIGGLNEKKARTYFEKAVEGLRSRNASNATDKLRKDASAARENTFLSKAPNTAQPAEGASE